MLINCVAYRDGAKLADIPVERISDHMGQPGCFVWVALRDASDEELAQMQHDLKNRYGCQQPDHALLMGLQRTSRHLVGPYLRQHAGG